jgi:hypothetical protein
LLRAGRVIPSDGSQLKCMASGKRAIAAPPRFGRIAGIARPLCNDVASVQHICAANDSRRARAHLRVEQLRAHPPQSGFAEDAR